MTNHFYLKIPFRSNKFKTCFIAIIFAFLSSDIFACDICGSGTSSNYMGILPEFNKHIVGIRYRYNSFQTHIGIGGVRTYLTTDEYYNTTELYGGFNIHKKWRILLQIPYNYNIKVNNSNSMHIKGLGDVNTTMMVNIFKNRITTKSEKLLINDAWIGFGIKLPTGKFYNTNNNKNDVNQFQLGTGSFDFMARVMYDIRYNNIGLNVNANYKYNLQNKYEYQFGNKFSISSQVYYKFRFLKNTLSIAPNMGFLYDTSKMDKKENETVDASGGFVFMSNIGIETNYKNTVLGISIQNPMGQNIAMNKVKANNQLILHLSYIF